MIVQNMSGKRLRAKRAARRELAAQIEAETSEIIKSATEGYNVSDVVYGADVATGTHAGNPALAQQGGGGFPLMPVLLVGGGALVLFMVMK